MDIKNMTVVSVDELPTTKKGMFDDVAPKCDNQNVIKYPITKLTSLKEIGTIVFNLRAKTSRNFRSMRGDKFVYFYDANMVDLKGSTQAPITPNATKGNGNGRKRKVKNIVAFTRKLKGQYSRDIFSVVDAGHTAKISKTKFKSRLARAAFVHSARKKDYTVTGTENGSSIIYVSMN